MFAVGFNRDIRDRKEEGLQPLGFLGFPYRAAGCESEVYDGKILLRNL
jgi:hypothetical protein